MEISLAANILGAKMKFNLDPHQMTTVDYCLKNKYSIMALSMGLGKTMTALAIWQRTGGNCLVVCPSYLVSNWISEIRKFLGEKPIITAIRKGKDFYHIFDSDFVIVSYDLAQKSEQIFEWADMVVLDEANYIMSMKAKRTEYLHRAIYENSIKRCYLLTGTPIKNRIEEYYSLLALCNYNPEIKHSEFLEKYPDSIAFADHFSYRKEYTMEINGRWVTIVKWEGVKNVEELRSNLKGKYIRFSSKDVLKLETPRTKDILISETADKKLLEEFENHYSDEDNHSVKSNYKAEAALKKVPFTVKYVKDLLEQIECVPIYTDHVESAKALAAAFETEAITGAMPAARRAEIGREFQEGKRRVLVATIKSFSTGISLTRANNLVLSDYSWVPGDIEQTIYRIHRRDQTRTCLIHRILGSPQDQQILNAVEEKIKTISKVV